MKKYLVEPGQKIKLGRWDPNDTSGFPEDKSKAKKALKQLNKKLGKLQEILYAQGRHRVLIVLQAMDTGGKDGTIRHVFEGVNPQGVKVASFKSPTHEELARDYLWRVHEYVPANGEIVIFNRSHYEDVLIVRVHNLVPQKIWERRYDHINDFERILVDEGTTILKFFLHIDLDEQKSRLEARLKEPDKQWKFRIQDIEERRKWDDYIAAYEAVLSKTSTDWAPWYIVPANHKWYRNYVIADVIVETLKNLKMKIPPPEDDLSHIVIP